MDIKSFIHYCQSYLKWLSTPSCIRLIKGIVESDAFWYSIYAIRLMPCNQPDLILLNKFGMLASSKGRVPHSSAYRITPIDHTSTSAPAYRLPHITCRVKDMRV
jgi:hypothetical protein